MNLHQYLIPFCLLLIDLAPAATAQQAGDYVRDPNLEKFEGRWQAENAPYTLTIIFNKEKVYYEKVDIHTDLILGWYELEREGKVIESSLDRVGNGHLSSSLQGNTQGNPHKMLMHFVDPRGSCIYYAYFTVDSTHYDQGTMKFTDTCILKGDSNETTAIPLPSEWQMEKIH